MNKLIIVALGCLLATDARSQQAVESFSKCVAESTTGRDRKDLAKWLFVAMGAHPEMKAIATVPPAAAEESSRAAGQLFTRLIADSCAKEARAAVQVGGSSAIQSAFNILGQLAMQELMADRDVAAGMSAIEKYVDAERVRSVLGGK
jgi:hypothetical protein